MLLLGFLAYSDFVARRLPMLVFHNNFARCECNARDARSRNSQS